MWMWTCVMEYESVKRKMSVVMGKWKWEKKSERGKSNVRK